GRVRQWEPEAPRHAAWGSATLDRPRQAQRGLLVEGSRDDLHAPGEARGAEAGGHGDGWQPGEVERRRRADERLDHGLRGSTELVLELVVALGRSRDSGSKERVEPLRAERAGNGLLDDAPGALGAEVDRGRQEQARLEQDPHVLADRIAGAGKARLVVGGRLR